MAFRDKSSAPHWLPDMARRYLEVDVGNAKWTSDLPPQGSFATALVDDLLREKVLASFWEAVCESSNNADDVWYDVMLIADNLEIPVVKKDLTYEFREFLTKLERHVDVDTELPLSLSEILNLDETKVDDWEYPTVRGLLNRIEHAITPDSIKVDKGLYAEQRYFIRRLLTAIPDGVEHVRIAEFASHVLSTEITARRVGEIRAAKNS